jgi:putative nucleotidyltransferase with HDIG domain
MVVKSRKKRFLTGVITAAAIGAAFCLFFHFNLFSGMQLHGSDSLFKAANLHPAAEPDERIVIVAIDDKSVEQLGCFSSWPRTYHAQLLDILADAEARTIVFDILFSEPTPDDGGEFTEQDMEALVSVASTAAMAIENARLHQTILDAYKSTIKALATAIDAKDPYTRGHSQRVMEYALLGGEALSLPEEEMETLECASILHDIGKIAITDDILRKTDTLKPKEREIMQEHSVIGANMLRDIPFLEKARQLILHHHERYDGKGYPHGLKGEEIPMGARLIAIADAFDTMTTDRAYRPALTISYTTSELYGCSGTQFCPLALDAFVSGLSTSAEKLSFNPGPESKQTAEDRLTRV